MKNIPYLLTYPRSGSHYFDDAIYKEIGIHIEKSHSVMKLFDKDSNKIKKIITIVRNPKDSITSYIANQLKNTQLNEESLNIKINQLLTEYIMFYNFLYEYADYIIDFNDLVTNTDLLIKKVINLLKIEEKDYIFFDRNIHIYSKEYVHSSKILSSYDKDLLNNFNLDLCYFYYNKILEKKIVI
jgi:hypothetical protein